MQFVFGYTNFSHAHERIQALDKSEGHIVADQAYAQAENCRDMEWCIKSALPSKRKEQILQKNQVGNHIFGVVKLLGRQRLSSRAHSDQQRLELLIDSKINHENFF